MSATSATPHLEIRDYFNSIRDEFKETFAASRKTDVLGSLSTFATVLLIFSVIPALPYAATRVARWLNISYQINHHPIPFRSFWFWWGILVCLLILVVYVFHKLESSRKKRESSSRLSKAQMRFALTYAIVDELADFQKNSRPSHIQHALDYAEGLFKAIPALLVPNLDIIHAYPTGELRQHIDPLSSYRRFSWFRLDPKTENILVAFRKLRSKIHDRIKDKKDLSAVTQILQELALYFYAEIPELQSDDKPGENSYAQVGEQALEKFAQAVEQLPSYSSERPPSTVEEKIQKKVSGKIERIGGLFMHPNFFACFITWLIFLAIVVCGGVWGAKHFAPDLKLDSTLVALIIGVPVAGAATLTGLSRPRTTKRDQATE